MDSTSPSRWDSVSRRRVLAGAAGVALVGVAGCSGAGAESLPAPVRGDPDGDVVVEVFSDFSCPHCGTFHREVLPELETGVLATGEVRLVHYDFPIPVDRWSWPAAQAARAVQDLGGDDAYWAFSHALYENQGRYSLDLFATLAADVGVDGATVRAAAAGDRYRDVVTAAREYGSQRGVPGTPAVVVADRFVSPTVDAIAAAVDRARD